MPELGEVEHATVLWRKYLVGRKIVGAETKEDNIVIVNPLTDKTLKEFVQDKQVEQVTRHGKYFWLRFKDEDQVLLLHFGMAGWVKVRGVNTHFLMMENGGDIKAKKRIEETRVKVKSEEVKIESVKQEEEEEEDGGEIQASKRRKVTTTTTTTEETEEWPPKYFKFCLKLDDGTEVAFTDMRRLGRIRLVEGHTDEDLFKVEPLVRSGPDYSRKEGRPSLGEFRAMLAKKGAPMKSLLLDQALFAGVGNWVADEILYQARIHPEQAGKTLTEQETETLYKTLVEICEFVVQVEGNTQKFPDNWLMLHRWGKGRKAKQTTFDGHAVSHVTVGGRTSCFVASLQKKHK